MVPKVDISQNLSFKGFSCFYHQIKSNAVRALGNLTRFIKCTTQTDKTNGPEEVPSTSNWIGSKSCASNPCHRSSLADSRWLERTVQALVSCVTTGNVKVQGFYLFNYI